MGFRFRKSVKIAPGVKLNFSKKGTSVTVGNKYARTTIGKDRKTVSASIPGTGVSYVKQTSNKGKASPTNANTNSFSTPGGNGGPKPQMEWSTALKIIKWAFIALLAFIVLMMFSSVPTVLIGAAVIIVGMILNARKKQGKSTLKRPWLITTFGWALTLILWVSGLPEATVETSNKEIVTPINTLTSTNNNEPVNSVVEETPEPEVILEEVPETTDVVNIENEEVIELIEQVQTVSPVEETAPISEPEIEAEYFDNCTHLRTKYPNGVAADHPAYQSKMDRDKDGWACER